MKTTVEVQNLKCGGCETTILGKLQSLERVGNISIDAGSSTVSFDYGSEATFHEVKKTLAQLGYPLASEKNSLGRKARSYVSCAKGRIGKS